MTKIYFVLHAQPEYTHEDNRTRPLSKAGIVDAEIVPEVLKDKEINAFYSSPHRCSIDTIKPTAEFFGLDIITDERLRERDCGPNGSNPFLYRKRWNDHDYHEEGGESLNMVQTRNIEALFEILNENTDKSVVIGTHVTALSVILNYFRPTFRYNDFTHIANRMPYIIRVDFDWLKGKKKFRMKKLLELGYIEKESPQN